MLDLFLTFIPISFFHGCPPNPSSSLSLFPLFILVPGKLNVNEFWEAIVRCAQVAYRNVDTGMDNKLKELFVNMSHKIDRSISKSVNFTGHRDVSTNGAMIISGMKKFQMALTILYREDGMVRQNDASPVLHTVS